MMAGVDEITTILCRGYMIMGVEVNIKGGFTIDFKKRNMFYYVLQKSDHGIYKLSSYKSEKQLTKSTKPMSCDVYTGQIRVHNFLINRSGVNGSEHVIFVMSAKQPSYFKPLRPEVNKWLQEFRRVARDLRQMPSPTGSIVTEQLPSGNRTRQDVETSPAWPAPPLPATRARAKQLDPLISKKPVPRQRKRVPCNEQLFPASEDVYLSPRTIVSDEIPSSKTSPALESSTIASDVDADEGFDDESSMPADLAPEEITFDEDDDDGDARSNSDSRHRRRHVRSIRRQGGKGQLIWDTVQVDIEADDTPTSPGRSDEPSSSMKMECKMQQLSPSKLKHRQAQQIHQRDPSKIPVSVTSEEVLLHVPINSNDQDNHHQLGVPRKIDDAIPGLPPKLSGKRANALDVKHIREEATPEQGYIEFRPIVAQREHIVQTPIYENIPAGKHAGLTIPARQLSQCSIEDTYVFPETILARRTNEPELQTVHQRNTQNVPSRFDGLCDTDALSSSGGFDNVAQPSSLLLNEPLERGSSTISRTCSPLSHCYHGYGEIPFNYTTELTRDLIREQRTESTEVYFNKHDILQGLVLVEYDSKVWVATWNHRINARAKFQKRVHIGDQILQVNNQVVREVKEAEFCIRSSAENMVMLVLKRLPFAKIVHARKNMSESWGCDFAKNELIRLSPGPLKDSGLNEKPIVPTGIESKWIATESQHQPVPIISCREKTVNDTLVQATTEILLVLHPKMFIDILVLGLETVPNITSKMSDYQL